MILEWKMQYKHKAWKKMVTKKRLSRWACDSTLSTVRVPGSKVKAHIKGFIDIPRQYSTIHGMFCVSPSLAVFQSSVQN